MVLANTRSSFLKEGRARVDLADHKARVGKAHACMHFGEYLQAFFPELEEGDRAAISAPVLAYADAIEMAEMVAQHNKTHDIIGDISIAETGSIVDFEPNESNALTLNEAAFTKSQKAAKLALDYLGKPELGGQIKVHHVVPEGRGLGTSTSDVIATINAVADAFHTRFTGTEVAKLAIQAEGACDSTMFDRAGLFVTTKCKFLDYYSVAFPRAIILGVDLSKNDQGIDTLSIPDREYSASEQERANILRKAARYAFTRKDLALIGQISTQSARINQRFVEKPQLEDIIKISKEAGSPGVVCAHSGTVLGLLFCVDHSFKKDQISDMLLNLESIGIKSVDRYYSA